MNYRPVQLWQLTTPYTDPFRPKRARSASHKFKPDEPVDAKMLAEYLKFKEDPTGRSDVDLQHLEAYLKIVRKRQRIFPEVYQQNINITDPYLYVKWPVLSYKWIDEQLAWARGNNEYGCRPWKEVDTLLIPVNAGGGHWLMVRVELTLRSIRMYDPWQQEVQYEIRNEQVACLRYPLPLMLNQIGSKRDGGRT
ncbi:hypothetical protein Ddye_017893 [Dipteronia dyeriana]|uniref:Ubiquitin-like protease family profile domain-containing protein n=1 Tax=Dipteronia dyeriana TaxID=168575 RepID=A0AAD9UAE3_9ROSI|nr:hypothetical protein Ddye_017893 [Dipteronia dyeriana]